MTMMTDKPETEEERVARVKKDIAEEKWRERLEQAIAESGKSKQAISREAGQGAGYVSGILAKGREPSASAIVKICKVLKVKPAFILCGEKYRQVDEDFIELFVRADHKTQKRVGELLLKDKITEEDLQALDDEADRF